QAALRAAEIKYQSLVEQISAVVFLDDINEAETTLYMSPRIEELTGYTSEEWLADPDIWMKCVHPDDHERISREYEKSHKYGTAFAEEYRLIRRDARTVWIKEDTNLIRDKDGNPSYWQGILLDITQERETQATIQESEERFRRIFHASPIATCVAVLEDGKFIDANQAFLDLIGRPLKDLLGHSSRELGFWQAGRWEFFVSQLREHGGVQGMETQYTNVPNGPKDTLAYYELIDLGGQPCILAMFYEVTEQKKAQKAMQRQLQELSVLHAAAIASAESYSEDEVIERVTKITAQLYAEVCGILLLNEQGDTLTPHPSCMGADALNWRRSYPTTEGLTGKAVLLGKILRTGQVSTEAEYVEIASGIQSELCVPIRVTERIIGVLNVESKKANAFDEGDERFLNTIAGGLGTTLEKLRLSKEEQQRARQLNSLYQATKSLTQSLKPEVIAEKLIANMDQMLGYEFGSVYLIEAESQMLVPLGISQKSQNLDIYEKDMGMLLTEKRALGIGILGWVAQHGQSIRSGDVNNEPRYLPVIKNIRSELCVPLIARGKTIGVVNIETTKPHAYTDADENLLAALASSAAIALENAQLYEVELKRREQAELLREATAALTTSIEPGALYEIILDSLLKLVPYDSASIELLDDGYWEIVAERGLPSEYPFVGRRYKTDQAKWGPLEYQHQPVIVPDVRLDGRFLKFVGTEYIRSWMGVPMFTHGKMIGYLNLDSRIVNFYTIE
ncbi:MAG: GAF domain-containing protein, partial [Chloroflexota bacterium]|nr:GAF domain-containing protein [Chloroflexota bacterium]